MKKNQFKVFFVLFSILGVLTWLSTACSNGNNPAGSGSNGTPTPTPLNSQTIWANGNTGSFFGTNLGLVPVNCTVANVSTPDTISGDNTTLQYNATVVATPVNSYFLGAAPENPTTYYASGHLQFDMKLNQVTTGNFTVGLAYQTAPSGGTTVNSGYSFPAALFNTSSFTHVSIALSNFIIPPAWWSPFISIVPSTSPVEPTIGPAFTVDNIQWTSN
jgi:hypothetical protein